MPKPSTGSDAVDDAVGTAAAVRAGDASAVAICDAALERAAAAPGVFWTVDTERARRDAAAVEARVASGEDPGPLAGVPVGIKDNFDVEGLPTTAGLPTRVHVAERDAAVVARLREAGAVVIGKTAMDQLAWSMGGQAPGFPPCENPAMPGRRPGGSSSGSAAAVAAGIVSVAIGSDSAGSTRLPAAWCGVIGHKPAFGQVSMVGCAPMAPSVDTVGLLTGTVADCELVLGVLGVLDGATLMSDPTVGVLDGHGPWRGAVECLRDAAGISLRPVSARLEARGLGRILAAEFAAAWADRAPALGAESDIVDALERASQIRAVDVLRAREEVRVAALDAAALFEDIDVLALPTVGIDPPRASDPPPDVAEASAFTRAINAYGWPAVSVPCGYAAGEPVAVQLTAPPSSSSRLLRVAALLLTPSA